MPHDFTQWWDCLKKHSKRRECWLRRAQEVAEAIQPPRPLRYLTLCALPMIDVFMLARENLLHHDEDFGDMTDVVFCESEKKHYPEIIEMLGVEGAGFPNRLEDLVLFENDELTEQFSDLDSVKLALENELMPDEQRERLLLKEQHFQLAKKFPFDFLNLDFCHYYYPSPPSMLEINRTVEKIVDLQLSEGHDSSGSAVRVNRFVMSITCRYDESFPEEAFVRLEEIVGNNVRNHPPYGDAIASSSRPVQPNEWRTVDGYDFFLSAWPKEILAIARARGLHMEILDYVHYQRPGYKIICLIASLERNGDNDTYVEQSLRALDPETRIFVDEIGRTTRIGARLLADLKSIVAIRNERARLVGRSPLPDP